MLSKSVVHREEQQLFKCLITLGNQEQRKGDYIGTPTSCRLPKVLQWLLLAKHTALTAPDNMLTLTSQPNSPLPSRGRGQGWETQRDSPPLPHKNYRLTCSRATEKNVHELKTCMQAYPCTCACTHTTPSLFPFPSRPKTHTYGKKEWGSAC